MSIFKNLFRKSVKEQPKPVDLTKLEHHYILHVGLRRCDLCNKETINCCKIDLADQCICICPRKDIVGFRRTKNTHAL